MGHRRVAGVLAHPTSFPGPFGIGDIGPAAHSFLDWLAGAEQKVWQVLPLGPTDRQGSPYRSSSAFAGNPLLISPEELAREHLVTLEDLEAAKSCRTGEALSVDFAEVRRRKRPLLEKAYLGFKSLGVASVLRDEFNAFCRQHADWLNTYAVFMALSEVNKTSEWPLWTKGVAALREPVDAPADAQPDASQALSDLTDFHRFLQFVFFRQWKKLREHAHARGICVLGDMPMYVSDRSADVWSNPDLFELDESGRPTRVAGVPPDYFSSTGQLWDNPLYNWKTMRAQGYAWWTRRLEVVLELVDVVRLDHFCGFHTYWAVPADEKTALDGKWVEGPGAELLEVLRQQFAGHDDATALSDGGLPIIAEDLGTSPGDVIELRRQFGLAGMSVLQFAFGRDASDRFLPENVEIDTVAYTGTHDNDTTIGWFENEIQRNPDAISRLGRYISLDAEDIAWEMIKLAWESRARAAIAPLQDVLSLGSESRMNTPGGTSGNWRWRFGADLLTADVQQRLAAVTSKAGRAG